MTKRSDNPAPETITLAAACRRMQENITPSVVRATAYMLQQDLRDEPTPVRDRAIRHRLSRLHNLYTRLPCDKRRLPVPLTRNGSCAMIFGARSRL